MEVKSTTAQAASYSGVVLIIGLVVYVIAWLAPVHTNVSNGFEAYKITYRALFEFEDRKFEAEVSFFDKVAGIASVISPHTNYFMIIIMLLFLFGRNSINKATLAFFRIALPICFVINLVWIYGAGKDDDTDSLKIGYYLWVLSFFLVSIALRIREPEKK